MMSAELCEAIALYVGVDRLHARLDCVDGYRPSRLHYRALCKALIDQVYALTLPDYDYYMAEYGIPDYVYKDW